ncbi:uncharacterized protein BDV14DRAFT_200916 [Aspergillus stella-maris]|uniref:uncharacterized protein n=1 Tax=Aspergillus stella-maris TaxID=1810926 RepID=UPI003CCD989E
MSQLDRHEMDVARSLMNMAHIPNDAINQRNHRNLTINTTQATKTIIQPQQHYTTNNQGQVFKSEHDQGSDSEATHRPHLSHQHHYQQPNTPSHSTTPVPIQRPYRNFTPASAPVTMNRERTLQDHLYRQQLLAGIAPENIIPIPQRPQANTDIQGMPSIIQFSNDGVFVPHIPPATYIPRTQYPVPPGEYDSRGSTPTGHGHYLEIPAERQPQNEQVFERERPTTTFAPNALRNGHYSGWNGAQGYNGGYHLNMNATYQNIGYNQNAYTNQGYYQRPTSAFRPNLGNTGYESGSYIGVKNEPDTDHHMLDYPPHMPNVVKAEPADHRHYTIGHLLNPTYAKNEHDDEARRYMLGGPTHASNAVKNEPEEDAQQCILDDRKYTPDVLEDELDIGNQQYVLRTQPHSPDPDYSLHARTPRSVPALKYEVHPTAFQSEPIKFESVSYDAQFYLPVKVEGADESIEDSRETQFLDRNGFQRTMGEIFEHPLAASQTVRSPIKEEAESENEPAAHLIDLKNNVERSPAAEDDDTTVKEKPVSNIEHGDTVPAVNCWPAVDILTPLLDHRELALNLTRYLDVQDLINLQATSRAARTFIIKNQPKVIRLQTHRSRTASFIFPWRCYQRLWFKRFLINDEIVPFSIPNTPGSVIAYTVSFRWLQMIKSRDRTVHSIITALSKAKYPFPRRYKSAIYKLWFLMDIPDTKRRQWTLSNRNLWTDLDLFMAVFFIIRIDMFVKIERGNKTGGQRRLIMAQPSLKFCLDVLTGKALRNDVELLAAFIRWHYNPRDGELFPEGGGVFGVPTEEVGSLQYEGYGEAGERMAKLRRPDELIIREASRRRLDFQDMYRRIFNHAEASRFAVCERPNSVWDQEMKRATERCNGDVQEALRLD